MLSVNQVPDVDLSVSAAGSNDVCVWSKIKSVNLGLVSNEGVHKAHHGVVPNLDGLVPGGGHNDWLLDVLEISDARDPVSVRVLINSEFANTLNVPELEALVHGAGSDLPIIWGEGNSEHILGVANQSLSCTGSLEVPESDGAIPGR